MSGQAKFEAVWRLTRCALPSMCTFVCARVPTCECHCSCGSACRVVLLAIQKERETRLAVEGALEEDRKRALAELERKEVLVMPNDTTLTPVYAARSCSHPCFVFLFVLLLHSTR